MFSFPTRQHVQRPEYTGLGLPASIHQVLAKHAHSVLLSDLDCSLTGAACRQRLSELERVFTRLSPLGGRVGVLLPNSVAQAVSVLAIVAAGRVPVMLNPSTTLDNLTSQLKSMRLHALAVPSALSDSFRVSVSTVRLNTDGSVSDWERMSGTSPSDLPPQGTGLLLYTSGSLGEPKGVALSQEGLSYTIETLIPYFKLSSQSVATITLPMFHTMALNTQFFPTFFAGGRCEFVDSGLSLGKVFRSIVNSGGTFVAMIGEMLRLCLEEMNRRGLDPCHTVEHVQIAGGIIRSDHLEYAKTLFPKATIHKGYGLTEGIRVTMIPSTDPRFFTETAGFVLPGQEVEVRDEDGVPLSSGSLGQIHVRGPNVMIGYDGRADSPFDERRFLSTGDLGMLLHDGRLVVQGRMSSVFKCRGRLLSAKEIELAALRSASGIRDAKCIPVPCHTRGFRPVLFLEIENGMDDFFVGFGKNEFEENLKKLVVENYKLPEDIFILHKFPRTPTGKVQNAAFEHLWSIREKAQDLGRGSLGSRFSGAPKGFSGVPFN